MWELVDLVVNKNFEIYNGALYESLVSESLIKADYDLISIEI